MVADCQFETVSVARAEAFSCGVYGYPIKDACKVAIDTTIDFINNNKSIKYVTFILFSTTDRQVYQDYLTSL